MSSEEILWEPWLDDMDRIQDSFKIYISSIRKNNSDVDAIEGLKVELHSIKGLLDLVGFKICSQTIRELEDNVHQMVDVLGTDLIDMLNNAFTRLSELIDKVEKSKPTQSDIDEIDKSLGFESILIRFGKEYLVEFVVAGDFSMKSTRALSIYNQIKRFSNIRSSTPEEEDLYFDVKFDVVKMEIVSRVHIDEIHNKFGKIQNITNISIVEKIVEVDDADVVASQDLTIRIPLSYIRTIESSLTTLSYHFESLKSETTSSAGLAEFNGIEREIENIQNDLRKMRKVPLDSITSPFSAMVTRLSSQESKDIELIIQGRFINLDRQLANHLIDPLTQILRNAISHGIELPNERVQKGKKETGTILINAITERDKIVIEVIDDGKGISESYIQDAIASANLNIDKSEISNPLELIFYPGFSTSKESTISGRGLGLSSAKERIEQIGGNILVVSKENEGTTFKLVIPDPDSLLKLVVFSISGETYSIPSSDIEDVLIVSESDLKFKDNYRAILKYKGNDLPISIVKNLLNLGELNGHEIETNKNELKFVIVTKGLTSLVGLLVDHIRDERLTNVKQMNKLLTNYRLFKGTILDKEKSIILVINPQELI